MNIILLALFFYLYYIYNAINQVYFLMSSKKYINLNPYNSNKDTHIISILNLNHYQKNHLNIHN